MPRTPSDKPKSPRGGAPRATGGGKPYVKRGDSGAPGGFDARGRKGGFTSGAAPRGPKRGADGGEFGGRAGKPYGDRAPRGEGGYAPRAPREGGDFAPRGGKPAYGDRDRAPRGEFAPRPPRGEGGYAPRGGKPSFGDRDRASRGEFGAKGPRGPKPAFGGVGEDGAYDREREHVQPAGAKAYSSYAYEAEEGRDDLVYGRHAVLALLESEQPVNKVWVLTTLRNPEILAKVRELAKGKGAVVQMVERPKLDGMAAGENHQGLVAAVPPVPYAEIETVIAAAKAQEHPSLLVLDGIEDPHNLGALLRTAEGASFAGVIIPNRRAVGITPTVYKSSAGAAARVPVARVGNLANALKTLKDAGFWLVGADAGADQMPYEVDLVGAPVAIVLGSEGKGLGTAVAKACDHIVKLPLGGQLESLNASVAGGVLMYEVVRQRLAQA